ncbi:hypothetical protein ACSDQ9_08945 [Aestuariimicrobium soli]|uniref:hypothetical protein n=1 Tax=Aestuariimicrobium soli TaxID=2035834 RepID=UPI003EBED774
MKAPSTGRTGSASADPTSTTSDRSLPVTTPTASTSSSSSSPSRATPSSATPTAGSTGTGGQGRAGQVDAGLQKPSFATLPYRSGGDAAHLDFHALPQSQLTVYLAFQHADVPAIGCPLVSSEIEDPTAQQRAYTAHVACVLKAWRPLYSSFGRTLPDIPVRMCALHPDDRCDTAFMSWPEEITVPAEWVSTGRADEQVTQVLNHEIAHYLQYRLDPRGGELPMAGVTDPDGARLTRRLESQAECLGTAMLAREVHGATMDDLDAWGLVYDGDESHWDLSGSRFWGGQGLKGRVGECNAPVAATTLVDYHP